MIIGIDQTGAINKNGSPKGLPIAIVRKSAKGWIAESWLQHHRSGLLNNFREPEFLRLIHEEDSTQRMLILDCVLGIPTTGIKNQISLDELLERASLHPGWGRSAAARFFNDLLKELYDPQPFGSTNLPTRSAEVLACANSVFRTRPFQKNIQTGTYRLWREIHSIRSHLWIFPHDIEVKSKRGRVQCFEGFPTLSFRTLLGSKSRNCSDLFSFMESNRIQIDGTFKYLVERSSDHRDALVLALHGWAKPPKDFAQPWDPREGSILGL